MFELFGTGLRWQIFAGIVDTGGKFSTGINDTSGIGGKICRQCR
jgi:hypothetical protein